ncbi:GNAT family N-acetyltransferase [Anaerorhabdus furcosa]|uniref:Putative acetyltransferase n=1 Tax=Anaerorhabdus furcosa TaxID=118967 RepID=A0A1T4Q1X2_9FIRM|nr:GNAT family N-acetyltransferase [Anaerorhabdus furcosa]SJZ97820.1 putative acetyltransferase [Anaerorhabdus furcosa]
MIRRIEISDIDEVARIWLDTNITAHNFISSNYWYSKLDEVQQALYNAEVFVIQEENKICGFIGLDKNYVLGIFVETTMQSKGFGKQLLDYSKMIRNELVLNVYQKNEKAIQFYKYQNFTMINELTDYDTNEKEYVMQWIR